jgi:hypothetical protein
MGVRKYRGVEEIPGPPPREPLDPDNLRLACGLSDLARRFGPRARVPGVYKSGSFDELLRERDRREAAFVSAHRTWKERPA